MVASLPLGVFTIIIEVYARVSGFLINRALNVRLGGIDVHIKKI